jgi:hypothetical protein
MKFYISTIENNINFRFIYKFGSFLFHTNKETTLELIREFNQTYGLTLEADIIRYESNELNSNFIYYDINGNISNTLFYFNKEDQEIDNTGVIQRLTGPDYCNFGSRTIYKGVKKSLPSKKYSITKNNIEISESDKRLLYNKKSLDSLSIESIESKILDYHRSLIQRYDKIHMAMSGGLDSRLSFCALKEVIKENVDQPNLTEQFSLLSYGSHESEDVKISKKIAQKFDHSFFAFPDYSMVWPTKAEYSKYCIAGNGIGISNWNMIGSGREFQNNECIVLGDLYEIIVGRKLEISFSRSSRLKFIKNKKKRNNFEKKPKLFISNKIIKDLTNLCEMKKTFSAEYAINLNWDKVINDTIFDMSEWMDIIPENLLPGQILEYFTLMAYTNPEYRNQIHTVRGFANAHSISEDLGLINLIVSIDPEKRKNNQLLRLLFKDSKIWNSLLGFPQASAPYLPAKYSSAMFINFQKLIRHQTEKIVYYLECIFPTFVKSRWSDWRTAYVSAKNRDMFNQGGLNVESYISSKSQIGKSLPIPNFAFVNFESILFMIKRK